MKTKPIIIALVLTITFSTVKAQLRDNCGDPLGTTGVTLDPNLVPMFENNLPVIKDLGLRIDRTNKKSNKKMMKVSMEETFQDLGLGLTDPATGGPMMTRVWGYKFPGLPATYPGATVVAMKDEKILFKWENNLPGHFLPVDHSLHMAHPNYIHGAAAVKAWYNAGNVPTVAHLHGGHTESASDGLPEAWFTQGFAEMGNYFVKSVYKYDNDQEAATLWYHDHALGITRLNVYAGLAGFYLLRDENENALTKKNVIPGGDYEIEIVIQDRMFDMHGQLFWPAFLNEVPYGDFITEEGAVLPTDIFPVNGGPTALAEYFGNIILVNGKAWPKLDVEPRKYRFRLLNGSDSRFYILKMDDGTGIDGDIMVIGTDNGLLESPVLVQELAIAPGERYDVIVDFSAYEPSTDPAITPKITVTNWGGDGPAAGAEINPLDIACTGTTGKIMQFQVTKPLLAPDATVDVETLLRAPILPLVTNAPSRKLVLFEGMDEFGRLQPMLGTLANGSQTWFEPITENPNLGAIEEWEVYNATGDAHPIHLHLVSFQIQNRETFTGIITPRPQVQHNSIPADLTTYGIGGVLSITGLLGDVTVAAPHEMGWKDTFIVPPDQVGRVRANFDRLGRYVWHCHILSHEDHEMMRPFHVGPIPATNARIASTDERITESFPNPFQTSTQIRFELKKTQNIDFTVFDMQGKMIYHNLSYYREGKNAIFWDGFDKDGKMLQTGVYLYKLQGDDFEESNRLVIER